MKVHEFLRHLAPSEKGKRLVIVNKMSTPLYDSNYTDETITEVTRKGLANETIMLIKTGQTYIKILSERL